MLLLSSVLSALIAILTAPPGRAAAPVAATDTEGKAWTLLAPAARQLDVLFFIATDCPVSNRYAPEIARICTAYQSRGVRCFLIYPDPTADASAVASHRREYGLTAAAAAIIDRDHSLVRATGARVTPEAALYTSSGRVYRGRIDDWYLDAGRPRRQATQHDLRVRIDAALAGRSIAPAETEAVGCFIANP